MEKAQAQDENLVVSFRAGLYADEIKRAAEKHNLSVGKWAKKVVLAALENPPTLPISPQLDTSRTIENRDFHRVSISLSDSEIEQINILMKNTKTANMSKMIVAIIRAFLLNKPIYSHDEVVELKRATHEMQTIGRNLNVIARNFIIGSISEADILTHQQLELLAENFLEYSNFVAKLLAASLKRHGIR